MANQYPRLDQIFAALADPTRRAVVTRLCEGEASVGQLAAPFDMALPSFMKHLGVLEKSGLVVSEKSGRVRTCRLRADAMSGAEQWLQHHRAVWESRLDRFEDYVATLRAKKSGAGRRARANPRKGTPS